MREQRCQGRRHRRAAAPGVCVLQMPPLPPTHRVPDLQLYLLAVYVDHARAELDADGQVMHGLEALVRELEQQAGLAHACRLRGAGGACVSCCCC